MAARSLQINGKITRRWKPTIRAFRLPRPQSAQAAPMPWLVLAVVPERPRMKPLNRPLNAFLALLSLSASIACGSAAPTAPSIGTQPASQSVLEGAAATFTVGAAGTAPLNYQWTRGGVAIANATSASYTTPATVMADSASSFTVTVSNSVGSITSSAATLTVNAAPPAIITQPASATVMEGSAAIFVVEATGTAPLSYQWRNGGIAISGATSASYTTPATALVDSGSSYTVTVTNAVTAVTSNAAVLTVQQ